MTEDFTGAKVAILWRGAVLTLLRDDRPEIPWPNRWDLPGGGREGAETPLACLGRETAEETGLRLLPGHVRHLSRHGPAWFAVARMDLSGRSWRLGDEGQALALMPVRQFLARPDAIPVFQRRLRAYLRGRARSTVRPPPIEGTQGRRAP